MLKVRRLNEIIKLIFYNSISESQATAGFYYFGFCLFIKPLLSKPTNKQI